MEVEIKILTSRARPAVPVLVSRVPWPESWPDLEQVANTLSQVGK